MCERTGQVRTIPCLFDASHVSKHVQMLHSALSALGSHSEQVAALSFSEKQMEAGGIQRPAQESLFFLFLLFLSWEKGLTYSADTQCALLCGSSAVSFSHMLVMSYLVT